MKNGNMRRMFAGRGGHRRRAGGAALNEIGNHPKERMTLYWER
jgi:hypothetical protein